MEPGPLPWDRGWNLGPALGPGSLTHCATREALLPFFSQVGLFHWLILFKEQTLSLQTYSFPFASCFILSQSWFYLYFQDFSRVILSPPPINAFFSSPNIFI